jgi:sulfide:quinone oxidoreductase
VSRNHSVRSYDGLHVLIAGGGVAALEAAFALRALAGDLVDLEILVPETRFFYSPQAVFEPFGGTRVQQFELSDLAEALGAQLTLGALASVASTSHRARTTHAMSIPYDVLVIACGASPRPVLRDALTFRGPADTDRVAAIVRDAHRGDVEQITLAIPTRRTWPLPLYELAFGLRRITEVPVSVATVEPAVAPALGPAGGAYLSSLLADAGIDVRTDVGFDGWLPNGITVAAAELWADRIYGIPADDDGFIPTNRFGAVQGVRDVYAAGDITAYDVKHGSLAAMQADAVAESIAARAGAPVEPAPCKPILRACIACANESVYVRRDLDDRLDSGVVSQTPLWSPPAKIFARHLSPALAQVRPPSRLPITARVDYDRPLAPSG